MWDSAGGRMVEGRSRGSLLAEVEGVLTLSYLLYLASSSSGSPRCEERRPPKQVWGGHAPLTLTPRTCSSSRLETQDRPALVHSNLYLG